MHKVYVFNRLIVTFHVFPFATFSAVQERFILYVLKIRVDIDFILKFINVKRKY